MKLSYAITVCNELQEITKLLNFLIKKRRKEDEIVILFDKKAGTPEVWSLLSELREEENILYYSATFKNHFANWKNKLTSYCSGDYIFQIDADECPHESLISQLPVIIEANPDNEVYLVPRVNTVKGLTELHIQKWGWRVDGNGWVNFPDYQWRIYKNDPKINWINKVHEILEGYETHAELPHAKEYCLIHPKEIKRQEKQNQFYNTL